MMEHMDSVDAEEAAAGRGRLDRRTVLPMIIAAVVMVVGAVWFGLAAAQQPVRWRDVGFTVDSPTQASGTYEVFLYTDADAVCRVSALSPRFAEVGYVDQRVDRAAGPEQRVTTVVTTVESATTVTVAYCEPVAD